jgi:hypothetical protein
MQILNANAQFLFGTDILVRALLSSWLIVEFGSRRAVFENLNYTT